MINKQPTGRNFRPAQDIARIDQAVFTAVCELPSDTHPDDILDAVCGQLPWELFTTNEEYITQRIEALT